MFTRLATTIRSLLLGDVKRRIQQLRTSVALLERDIDTRSRQLGR